MLKGGLSAPLKDWKALLKENVEFDEESFEGFENGDSEFNKKIKFSLNKIATF